MYKNTRVVPHLPTGIREGKLRLLEQNQSFTYDFTYLHKERGTRNQRRNNPWQDPTFLACSLE
jgi:hypothetical protein